MEAIEAILTRRSIREYTTDPLEETPLETLLKAAMSAPSAGNQQSWHFIIIRDKSTLEQITKMHPHADMLKQAQVGILVCADVNLEKYKNYFPLDCSAATQNLLLAAHALGIGACWLGIYPREERMNGISHLFNLPSHVRPVNLISLGHPSVSKKPSNRFKTDRIHQETW